MLADPDFNSAAVADATLAMGGLADPDVISSGMLRALALTAAQGQATTVARDAARSHLATQAQAATRLRLASRPTAATQAQAAASARMPGRVLAAATFFNSGKTYVAVNDGFLNPNFHQVFGPYAIPSGALRRLWIYLNPDAMDSGTGLLKAVVYKDLAGEPTDLIATSVELAVQGQTGFNIEGEGWVGISGYAPAPGDIPLPRDYDGDAATELGVYRPSTGEWFIEGVGAVDHGIHVAGDVPCPFDYDDDGTVELVVFRPSTGSWYVEGSSVLSSWGTTGDIPLPGEYDTNGNQIAIWRPSDGTWYFQSGSPSSTQWGVSTDTPMPADYNNLGYMQIAVWRGGGNGTWYVSGGTPAALDWGSAGNGDVPVNFDEDGDGKAEYTVYRAGNSTWYSVDAFTGTPRSEVVFGVPGALPIPLNRDGSGATERAYFLPVTSTGDGWYALDFTPPVIRPAANVWIGFIAGGDGILRFVYDGGPGVRKYRARTYSSGPYDPFGSADATDAQDISIYVESTLMALASRSSTPGRVLSATQAQVATRSRLPGRVLAATQAQVASRVRASVRTLVATQAQTATRLRTVVRTLAVTQAQAATVATMKVSSRTLTALQGQAATLARTAARILLATQGETATLSRATGRSVVATQAQTATRTRTLSRVLAPGTFNGGKTYIADNDGFLAPEYHQVFGPYAVQEGTLQRIWIYLNQIGAGTAFLKAAVYTDVAGDPTDLLVTGVEVTFQGPGSPGWYALDFATPEAIAAGDYWLGFIAGGDGILSFISGGGPGPYGNRKYKARAYSAGLYDPFGTPDNTDAQDISIYVEGTTGPVAAATVARQLNRLLAVAQASSASLRPIPGRVLAATQAQAATRLRATARTLAAVQAQVATLTSIRVTVRTVSATQAQVAAVARVPARILASSQAQAATASRVLGKLLTLTATQAQVAAVARAAARSRIATQAQAATIATIKVTTRSVAAVQASVASLSRASTRLLASTLTTSATLGRATARTRAATQPQTSTVAREPRRTHAATQPSTAFSARTPGRTVVGSASTSAALSRAVARSLAALLAPAATLEANWTRKLSLHAVVTALATVLRQTSIPTAVGVLSGRVRSASRVTGIVSSQVEAAGVRSADRADSGGVRRQPTSGGGTLRETTTGGDVGDE